MPGGYSIARGRGGARPIPPDPEAMEYLPRAPQTIRSDGYPNTCQYCGISTRTSYEPCPTQLIDLAAHELLVESLKRRKR